MISEYYRTFKVNDYLPDTIEYDLKKEIDCSLGTNPFIEKRLIDKYMKKINININEYPINSYSALKIELLKFYEDILDKGIDEQNISFGSGTMGIIRNLSEFLIEENTMRHHFHFLFQIFHPGMFVEVLKDYNNFEKTKERVKEAYD